MTKPLPPPFDDHRADRAAAEWLVKRDRGFTPAEQDEFFSWLAADPRHGEWLARHQRTWKELNALAQWRPEHSAEPNPDLLAKPARRASRWLAWTLPLAAAAAFAFALLREAPVVTTASAEPPAAAPAAPEPKRFVRLVPLTPLQLVASGYTRRVLADGSVVELNRGAAVEIVYNRTARRVHLVRGEASFSVAKDVTRPFIVRAGGVDVRALGTVFNVRVEERSVEVLVTEGKVRIDDAALGDSMLAPTTPGETPVLAAGHKVSLDPQATAPVAASAVTAEETARLLAWHPVLLEFDQLPLRAVVQEFNRHNRTQLVIADAALGDVPIVASFRSENLEGFVRLLEEAAGVHAERRDDQIVLHVAR